MLLLIVSSMSSMKMKIPSFLKNKQWPSCKQYPKTLSFRANKEEDDDNMFKSTVNSIFFNPTSSDIFTTNTSERGCSSFSTEEENTSSTAANSLETIIRGVRRSERLFFEPKDNSSILRKNNNVQSLPFKESVALAMESDDPYTDFKKSMQEMVETQGIKDWDCLEELLAWYLKMNGKTNHGYIVGAFIDLLVGSTSSLSSSSYSSAVSSFSSPSDSPTLSPAVPVLGHHDKEKEGH